jgi:nicotinate-nucleotide--dimethylbenzimidazole phosphoribosyltransferase
MITAENIQSHLDSLAKPPGSLGTLERLAARLATVQGTLKPITKPRRLLLFAGDHGVVADGVGIWPSEVTSAMIGLIANERAASSALARSSGTGIDLIDVGSKITAAPKSILYRDQRVARGTQSLAHGPAMTSDQFWKAWMVGDEALKRAKAEGARVIGVGEIGIGNTTPAACLIALIADVDPALVVGQGAGATEASLAKKHAVVKTAVKRVSAQFEDDPIAAIAAVAGFEIVAMAGAIAAAAQADITVVLDGVVTAAAALVAAVVDPAAIETAIASHVGAEPAHKLALEKLELEPFLDWHMRLGEGTGALLLMPMLDAAAALLSDVATLKEVAG